MVGPPDRLAVGFHDGVGGEDVQVGMPHGEPGQRLQPPWQKYIVGVQHDHVVTPGVTNGEVLRRRLPAVLLADRRDRPAEAVQDTGGAVRRAVIADDDLKGGVGLPQRRTHRLADRRLRLVCRDDDRKGGLVTGRHPR
jgi:hypothetical protein